MAYNPELDLPDEHALARVLNYAPNPIWRRRFHSAAEEHSGLYLAGHNTLVNNFGRVVTEHTLDMLDLGAELYEIIMQPELMGLDAQEVPTYQDPIGFQVAINTANILGEYRPSDLLGFADDTAMALDKEAPVLAGLLTMVTGVMFHDTLSPRGVQKVKAGAGIMRTMDILAWLEYGKDAA